MRTFYFSLSIILSAFLLLSCGTENKPIHNFAAIATPEEAGTINPSFGQYEEGKSLEVRAIPTQGWEFIRWEGDLTQSENPTRIIINKEYNVTGVFERKDFSLNITVEGEGTVQERIVSQPKATEYPFETVIQLTSKPNDGWVFYEWSGDIDGNDNPQTIEIDEQKEVTSKFKSIDELLTIEISGEGTVDIQQESFEDNPSRRTVTLTPNPSEGWSFKDWSGDLSGDSVPQMIVMNEEKNITVKFVPTVFLGENGISIMCPDGKAGEKGFVNGVEYEVVDRDLLEQRIDEGSDLTKVCVTLVTDMSKLFSQIRFNQPIGSWDVSSVTNMSRMFQGNSNNKNPFNQPIGTWDVSNVTDMSGMFGFSQFNQPIGDWDVSNVTVTGFMFYGSNFNQPIGNWDVSSVQDMSVMFYKSQFNQPIGEWDVSNVTTLGGMFWDSQFNKPIGNWDVSNVENMVDMFYGSNFNQDISSWCVHRINNEPYRFSTDSPLTPENKPIWGTCPD